MADPEAGASTSTSTSKNDGGTVDASVIDIPPPATSSAPGPANDTEEGDAAAAAAAATTTNDGVAGCVDDPEFVFVLDSISNEAGCDWVAQKPNKRCHARRAVLTACPATCDTSCSTSLVGNRNSNQKTPPSPPPPIPANGCVDDPDFIESFSRIGEGWRGCDWIAIEPSERCILHSIIKCPASCDPACRGATATATATASTSTSATASTSTSTSTTDGGGIAPPTDATAPAEAVVEDSNKIPPSPDDNPDAEQQPKHVVHNSAVVVAVYEDDAPYLNTWEPSKATSPPTVAEGDFLLPSSDEATTVDMVATTGDPTTTTVASSSSSSSSSNINNGREDMTYLVVGLVLGAVIALAGMIAANRNRRRRHDGRRRRNGKSGGDYPSQSPTNTFSRDILLGSFAKTNSDIRAGAIKAILGEYKSKLDDARDTTPPTDRDLYEDDDISSSSEEEDDDSVTRSDTFSTDGDDAIIDDDGDDYDDDDLSQESYHDEIIEDGKTFHFRGASERGGRRTIGLVVRDGDDDDDGDGDDDEIIEDGKTFHFRSPSERGSQRTSSIARDNPNIEHELPSRINSLEVRPTSSAVRHPWIPSLDLRHPSSRSTRASFHESHAVPTRTFDDEYEDYDDDDDDDNLEYEMDAVNDDAAIGGMTTTMSMSMMMMDASSRSVFDEDDPFSPV